MQTVEISDLSFEDRLALRVAREVTERDSRWLRALSPTPSYAIAMLVWKTSITAATTGSIKVYY